MRNLIYLIIALIAMSLYSCGGGSESIGVKTNYYDLPEDEAKELKEVLELDAENQLTTKSVEVLHQFLYGKLLNKNTPLFPSIKNNYFWNIYNALPDFVSKKERHNGYYMGEGNSNERTGLLAYSFYRLDRSSENIQHIYDYIKPHLTGYLSKDNYDRFGFQNEINSMIYAYSEIITIPDYEKLFEDAYNHVDTATGVLYTYEGVSSFNKFSGAYGCTVSDLNQIICSHFDAERYSTIAESPYLSFWMRRNHEGNMQTVYNILGDVYETYRKL